MFFTPSSLFFCSLHVAGLIHHEMDSQVWVFLNRTILVVNRTGCGITVPLPLYIRWSDNHLPLRAEPNPGANSICTQPNMPTTSSVTMQLIGKRGRGNREVSVKAVNASCKSASVTTSGTARQTKALSFHPFVKAHYHSFTAVCSVVKLDIKSNLVVPCSIMVGVFQQSTSCFSHNC